MGDISPNMRGKNTENPTNVLTSSDAFDPLAKIPEFKASAVQMRKQDA